MKVEDQVAIIYAATNGLLDTVPVNRVREFEKEFTQVLNARHPDVLKALKAGKLDDAVTWRPAPNGEGRGGRLRGEIISVRYSCQKLVRVGVAPGGCKGELTIRN